jgi:hypothetical protein
VRLVGQPGETPLYISNEKFFPKLNALLEVTDLQKIKYLILGHGPSKNYIFKKLYSEIQKKNIIK